MLPEEESSVLLFQLLVVLFESGEPLLEEGVFSLKVLAGFAGGRLYQGVGAQGAPLGGSSRPVVASSSPPGGTCCIS